MINEAQAHKDFDALLANMPKKSVKIIGFKGQSTRGIVSGKRLNVVSSAAGDVTVIGRSVRIKSSAFDPLPWDNDIITLDGEEFQVADTHEAQGGFFAKITILSKEA